MQDGRWYPSVAALPNDEALIIGGGPTVAEVRTQSGGLRRLTGVVTPSSREYPFVQAAPDGRALLFGPGRGMSLIDTVGLGALSPFGNRDAINRTYGSYAPYAIGKFLVAGGGPSPRTAAPRCRPGRRPRWTRAPARPSARRPARWPSAAASTTSRCSPTARCSRPAASRPTDGGGLVDLANAVYAAERWDPATGAWTTLASASVARQYHSTALLLPDGRVLTGGGGICGVCQQVGYLRKDMEIFSPPYLFAKDGSGQPAARPQITGAPATISYDGTFTVSSPAGRAIRKIALVRLGAPTHSEDQSQRYVPLTFSASGTTLNVLPRATRTRRRPATTCCSPSTPRGCPRWPPSLGAAPAAARARRQPRAQRPATGSTACATTEGPAKAVNGSVSGGKSDKFCSNGLSRDLSVDLGSAHGPHVRDQARRRRRRDDLAEHPRLPGSRRGRPPAVDDRGDRDRQRRQRHDRHGLAAPGPLRPPGRDRREQGDPAGAARIYELEVYAGASAAGRAAPAGGLLGPRRTGRAQRFEAGRYMTPAATSASSATTPRARSTWPRATRRRLPLRT